MTAFDELERQLRLAVRSLPAAQDHRRWHLGGARGGRGWSRRSRLVAVIVAISLPLGGLAFAATRLIGTGAPVPRPRGYASLIGAIKPGTTRLLSIRAADPGGGPPWGLRVFRTTRGLACVQPGRVVNGKLGVLGQDGVFYNDGRFHELPISDDGCGAVDGRGQMFMDGGGNAESASGYWGATGGCETRRERTARLDAPRLLRETLRLQLHRHERAAAREERKVLARYERIAHRKLPVCPTRDLRDVIWGFAGSKATRITLTDTHTNTHASIQPEARASGAYLFVLPGDYSQHTRLQRRYYYPHGIVCGRGFGVHPTAGCDPPPGFIAPKHRPRIPGIPSHPPRILPSLHLHVTVLRGLTIRFTPVANDHRYTVTIRCSHHESADAGTTRPLPAGHPALVRLHPPPPNCHRPPLHGQITDIGPGPPPGRTTRHAASF